MPILRTKDKHFPRTAQHSADSTRRRPCSLANAIQSGILVCGGRVAINAVTARIRKVWPTASGRAVEQLAGVVGELSGLGINVIVGEINYGYKYKSHPELARGGASGPEQIRKLLAECREHKVRLIPQFQRLGHQSWSKRTAPLLTKYPQFDETPDRYPNNEGIYCRSWCPLHPEVNKIVFELMDELIEVFEADAMHVGLDEVFLIGDEDCPRCKGKAKAELLAKAINDYHGHLVGKHKIEMLMWGDRLIDASKYKYGKWEASANDTAGAIDIIPKDIVICDWHYNLRDAYESVPMFLEKGFRVWPASWKKPDAAKAFVDYSRKFDNERMLGNTSKTKCGIRCKYGGCTGNL